MHDKLKSQFGKIVVKLNTNSIVVEETIGHMSNIGATIAVKELKIYLKACEKLRRGMLKSQNSEAFLKQRDNVPALHELASIIDALNTLGLRVVHKRLVNALKKIDALYVTIDFVGRKWEQLEADDKVKALALKNKAPAKQRKNKKVSSKKSDPKAQVLAETVTRAQYDDLIEGVDQDDNEY